MPQQVITFHYRLTDQQGKLIESTEGAEPLAFLEGSGQVIPGLEDQLVSLKVGDKKDITVPYALAYGAYDQTLIQKISRQKFPAGEIQVGDTFQVGKDNYHQLVTVIEVSDASVTIDANYPLAGQDLNFAAEIVQKREATVEEVAHGHAHGDGGHQH